MKAPGLILLTTLLSQPAAAELKKPSAAPSVQGRVLEKQAPCRTAKDSDLVQLDFDGSTVRELALEVGRLLCRNFVLDPSISKRRVVVLSSAPIRVDVLWPTFLHILRVNDLTIVDRGSYQAIMMASDGTRESVPTYGVSDEVPPEERMITKVVKFRGRDVNATTNFLNIFKTGKGQIHPFASAGIIVITDFASSVARLEWLLGQMTPTRR